MLKRNAVEAGWPSLEVGFFAGVRQVLEVLVLVPRILQAFSHAKP